MERQTKIAVVVVVSSILILVGLGIIFSKPDGKKLKYPNDAKWVKTSNNLKEVERLHPRLRQDVADFFTEVEKKGYTVRLTDGERTTQEQASLDSQNDQNAEAGTSDHEYGFAFDINIMKNGEIVLRKASSKKAWIDSGVVAIAKKHGFKWGGDFKTYHDPIHFYNDFGIPATQMKKLKLAGKVDKQGYLIV